MSSTLAGPEAPERLVLVVDIANIRDRSKSKRFNFKLKREPASLEFIDRCLDRLSVEAPGSVIMNFTDHSLRKDLPKRSREEYDRRSKLVPTDPDKFFVVGTAQADDALICAARDLGVSIISHDKFEDKNANECTVFRFHSESEEEKFIFQTKDGLQLHQWWEKNVGILSDEWIYGKEQDDLACELRDKVKNATWQYHGEPLTEVMGDRWPQLNKLRPEKEVQLSVIKHTREEPSHFEASTRVIYADQRDILEENLGRVVTIVGRLVTIESIQFIEWFRGFQPIALIGELIPEVNEKYPFVRVTGRLSKHNEQLNIQLDPQIQIESPLFAEVVESNPIYLESEGWSEWPDIKPWQFPSLRAALVRRATTRAAKTHSAHEIPVSPAAPVVPVIPVSPAAPVVPVIPVSPAAPVVPVIPVSPAAPVVPVIPVSPAAPVVPVIPKTRKILVIVISIVAGLVLAFVAYRLWMTSSDVGSDSPVGFHTPSELVSYRISIYARGRNW